MRMRVGACAGIIFFLALLIGGNASARQSPEPADHFALVIGDAKYPDSEVPLRSPVNDARALAKELRHEGFDVDLGMNLSISGMRDALNRLYGKITPGSVALLFFSGYGIQVNRASYLIPVDAEIWSQADVLREGFSVDSILREMARRGAKIKIAIIDASRRNPFERRFRSVAMGLAPVASPQNTLVMYSAAPGVVLGSAEANHSLFVSELIKKLKDKNLTGEEVFNQARLAVSRLSLDKQTPWFSSSLGQAFYFSHGKIGIKKPAAPKPADVVARPKVAPKPQKSASDEVHDDYEKTKRLGTRKAWKRFLDEHPNGEYADLAREQLAALPPKEETNSAAVKSKQGNVKPAYTVELSKLDSRLARDPDDADAHNKRGIIYVRKKEYRRAIADFSAVIRIRPKDAQSFNNRCWARAMLGTLEPALHDCDEALRIRPNFADALDSRGLVKLKIGLPRSAIADYDAALQIDSRKASSLYGRGIAKLRSGNIDGGNSDIAVAKSIDPAIAKEFASYGIQ